MQTEIALEDVAFFAGVVDSKGSITIGLDNSRGKQYYYEQYRVSGEQETLERLRDHFGGSISTNGRNCRRIWRVTADVAHNLFIRVRPMLVRRRYIVDVAIEFGNLRRRMSGVVEGTPKETAKNIVVKQAERARTRLRGFAQAEIEPGCGEVEDALGKWLPSYCAGAGITTQSTSVLSVAIV